jgi:hypothetical protein
MAEVSHGGKRKVAVSQQSGREANGGGGLYVHYHHTEQHQQIMNKDAYTAMPALGAILRMFRTCRDS